MSFIPQFNFTFNPSLNLAPYSSQLPFSAPNRFAQQPQPDQYNAQSVTNLPLPESIAQNYQQQNPQSQSYVDYYGNQNHNTNSEFPNFQNQNQNYENPQNAQNFQPQQPQPAKRRRAKNARARNANANVQIAPRLIFGPGDIQPGLPGQNVQNLQTVQSPQNFDGFNFNPIQNPIGPHDHDLQNLLRVTPIQGPIFAKDGHVPVVPLYSYPTLRNGTFYQIPILWTALSYALGLEIRGEILRGLPCIKRLNQLFCPTAGNTYPLDHIERFIDENKALIKRMYGEFVMNSDAFASPLGGGPGSSTSGSSSSGNLLRRSAREVYEDEVAELFGKVNFNSNQGFKVSDSPLNNPGNVTFGENSHTRTARQTVNPKNGGPTQQPKSNRVDSCESTVEITTPYWAANSAGKVRAIVNTKHFEQAIHQEVCSKTSTKRCTNDCGCEQKYKWHRLLAYDPDNDCRGIFMDWFLFPSCCVCRCNP